MMNEQKFLTVDEFSKQINCHPNTIRRGLKSGRFQGFRVGDGNKSSYRIPITEVDRVCEFDTRKLIKIMIEEEVEKVLENKK